MNPIETCRTFRGISCRWMKDRNWRCSGIRPRGLGEREGERARQKLLPGAAPGGARWPFDSVVVEVVEEEEVGDTGVRGLIPLAFLLLPPAFASVPVLLLLLLLLPDAAPDPEPFEAALSLLFAWRRFSVSGERDRARARASRLLSLSSEAAVSAPDIEVEQVVFLVAERVIGAK